MELFDDDPVNFCKPCCSIGLALFERGKTLAQLWLFIVAPSGGAALSAGVWKIIGSEK
nr:hypothetical protein [Odoribacter splanchnicus]